MFHMADRWKFRFGTMLAVALLAAVLGSTGCSTFHERPGHTPYSVPKSKAGRNNRKSSTNPLSRMGSIFKKDEPRLAESPDEFVGLPRPDW